MLRVRYKTVVDQLADEIQSGKLRPGTKMPTHRALAERYGLALVTATRVYAELASMGLVSGETGRGTFVRDVSLPIELRIDQGNVGDDMIDLNFNYPSLPGQAELLRSALRQLSNAGDIEALLRYQPHTGRYLVRQSMSEYASLRGLSTTPDNLAVVDGAQHGLAVTCMALLKTGDVVAVDAMTYPGFKLLANHLGLELVPIPAEEGLRTDLSALAKLCEKRRIKAVYVQPTIHNPLGWVMNMEQRITLVELARKRGFMIIEDSPYAFLAQSSPPPLAELAPEITVYVSGFSKSVATGLRVGFLVAPQQWITKIERAIRCTTWNTSGILTTIVSNWIEDGTVERLEMEKRMDAIERQKIATQCLAGLEYSSHPSSYFMWLPLEENARAESVVADLMANNISVSTADPFATTTQVPRAIRIALGSVSLSSLQIALAKVKEVIEYHT